MRCLVQRENVALFAVILGLFADCSSSLTTIWGGAAGIAVTALLDQKGDMLLGSGESLRNSLAVIFRPGQTLSSFVVFVKLSREPELSTACRKSGLMTSVFTL